MPKSLAQFVVVGVALTVAVGCGDAQAKRAGYLKNGDRLVAEGNLQAAAVEFRNAVALDEMDGAARLRLADAYARLGDWRRARAEYLRAADLLPTEADAQVAAAQVLLRSGEFQDARARAERALSVNPKHATAHLVRGNALAGLKELDDAVEAYEEGAAADPNRSDLYVSAAAMHVMQGNEREAEASYKQAVSVDPSSVPAKLALANFYMIVGEHADAELMIKEALKTEPTNVAANRALADLYIALNRAADAEAPLRVAADNPGEPRAALRLADYYVMLKRHAEALPILDRLASQPASFAAASSRRAAIAYELGQRAEAYKLLDEILAKQPANVQVMVLKGNWLAAEQRFDEALAMAKSAIDADAQAWAAFDLRASVLLSRRQRQGAIEAYNEVLRLNPRATNAQIALSELNAREGKAEAAVRFADEAVQSDPLNGRARLALVRALLAADDEQRARVELQPLLAGSAHIAAIQNVLGQIEMRGGKVSEARAAFGRAMELDPTSVEALTGLVRLDVRGKALPTAIRRVEEYTSKVTDNPSAFVLASRTYAAAGALPEAEVAVKKAIELDPAYLEAYGLLGQLYVRQQKLSEARREYESVIKQRPSDITAHTMVGMLLQAENRQSEARQVYERVISLDGRAVVAANNLAYMYALDGGNLDMALNLAQTAKAGRPDDPDINDTLGWIYYKRQLPSLAIDPLELSVRASPANPLYLYHLGMVYLSLGQQEKARQALERALKIDQNFAGAAEARKALADIEG